MCTVYHNSVTVITAGPMLLSYNVSVTIVHPVEICHIRQLPVDI